MSTSSSSWSASTLIAGPVASSASVIVVALGVQGGGEVVHRLERPDDVGLLGVERADDVLERAEQRPRSRSSRPLITWLSSSTMVPSWATPPPLSRNDSAPSTSSTSGLRPVAASGMLSPSPSWSSEAPDLGRLERDVLLAEQADLADVGDRVVGELDVVADAQGDLGVPADPLDVDDLADDDVVDHHRGARHDVEDVGELGGHLGSCCPRRPASRAAGGRRRRRTRSPIRSAAAARRPRRPRRRAARLGLMTRLRTGPRAWRCRLTA